MPRRCEMNSATSAPARPATSKRRRKTNPEIGDDIELTQAERVGADAEIGAVAERWQSGRAEHEIERERVDRPDQDLDAEIGIEADRAIHNGTLRAPATAPAWPA